MTKEATAPTVHLSDVQTAARDLAEAQRTLRTSALEAMNSGASVSEVAELAGVTRQTLYNWRKETQTAPVADSPEDDADMRRRAARLEAMHAHLRGKPATYQDRRKFGVLNSTDTCPNCGYRWTSGSGFDAGGWHTGLPGDQCFNADGTRMEPDTPPMF